MTYTEAKEKLKLLSRGEFCHIEYETLIHEGRESVVCRLSIVPTGEKPRISSGSTWREAFEAMLIPDGAADPEPGEEGEKC